MVDSFSDKAAQCFGCEAREEGLCGWCLVGKQWNWAKWGIFFVVVSFACWKSSSPEKLIFNFRNAESVIVTLMNPRVSSFTSSFVTKGTYLLLKLIDSRVPRTWLIQTCQLIKLISLWRGPVFHCRFLEDSNYSWGYLVFGKEQVCKGALVSQYL